MKEERDRIRGQATYSTLDGDILKMESPVRKVPGGRVSQKSHR